MVECSDMHDLDKQDDPSVFRLETVIHRNDTCRNTWLLDEQTAREQPTEKMVLHDFISSILVLTPTSWSHLATRRLTVPPTQNQRLHFGAKQKALQRCKKVL